jgi:uncharacterized membrane protein YcaP (DUF421 family)
MGSSSIELTDFHRILLGELPWSFLIEVVGRVAFVYLLLLVCMRLMGKRMAGQVSRTEMVALVSLAAAIGLPIQTAERGLLPSMVVALTVVLVERIATRLGADHARVEHLIDGGRTTLVQDGALQLPALRGTQISRERVFSQLRSRNIKHLGSVRRLYIEANGGFSLVPEPEPRPGLSISPIIDEELSAQQKRSEQQVCEQCGRRRDRSSRTAPCSGCGGTRLTHAIC